MSRKRVKIPKEVLDKVLYLDCREEDNIRRLKKSLIKLPFIKSKNDLTTDSLEKIIKRIEFKFDISLNYVMRSIVEGKHVYTGTIGNSKGDWIRTVYGINMWEVFAKVVFAMYYYVNINKGKK